MEGREIGVDRDLEVRMSHRFEWLVSFAGGSVFLVATCVLLPLVIIRHVAAVLAGAPAGLLN